MVKPTFAAALRRLGITTRQAARTLRVSLRTVENWRQGRYAYPRPALRLLIAKHWRKQREEI